MLYPVNTEINLHREKRRKRITQIFTSIYFQAGIASHANPEQLLIALEPEAASICIRKLRLRELLPEKMSQRYKWIRSSMRAVGLEQFVQDNIIAGKRHLSCCKSTFTQNTTLNLSDYTLNLNRTLITRT